MIDQPPSLSDLVDPEPEPLCLVGRGFRVEDERDARGRERLPVPFATGRFAALITLRDRDCIGASGNGQTVSIIREAHEYVSCHPSVTHHCSPMDAHKLSSSHSRNGGIQPMVRWTMIWSTFSQPRMQAAAFSTGLPVWFRSV
jgi:hypothetical protein